MFNYIFEYINYIFEDDAGRFECALNNSVSILVPTTSRLLTEAPVYVVPYGSQYIDFPQPPKKITLFKIGIDDLKYTEFVCTQKIRQMGNSKCVNRCFVQ